MSRRGLGITIGIVALALSACSSGYCADDPAALLQRMASADSRSALDSTDLKPWHLKLTVNTFDDKGKAADRGTIEEWWSSEHDRREYSTGAYHATEVRKDGKLYRTKDAGSPPYYLELLREQAVHPIPKYDDDAQSKPELRKQPFGKVQLDCIMMSQQLHQFGYLPLGLFPTYCFDPGLDVLRASFDFGQQLVVRNAIGSFQNKKVATKVAVMLGQVQVANSEIVGLEALTSPIDVSTDDIGLAERDLGTVKVSSGVVAGMALSQPAPIYPEPAKRNHISGTVVLHAVIGTDGHIHSLKVISAPDPDLAISAIAAVRTWVYKPYLLLGVPTDVETTINVNYTFGS